MKILVLNSGSSSLKFQLIETSSERIEANEDRLLVRGAIENIGTEEAIVSFVVPNKRKVRSCREILEHKDAIRVALEELLVEGPSR